MLPYFASNGAIIHGTVDRDRYNISVPPSNITVIVDTDTWDEDGWTVDHPPAWLHTDEEGEQADDLARAALQEYYQTLTKATPPNP